MNSFLLLKVQLIIIRNKKHFLVIDKIIEDSKKCNAWSTCERIKKRKGTEREHRFALRGACWTLFYSTPLVPRSQSAHRAPLAQSVKVQAACHLAFLSIIPPDKTARGGSAAQFLTLSRSFASGIRETVSSIAYRSSWIAAWIADWADEHRLGR